MSGARHRRKGSRVELEVVKRHKELGVHAEKYPLSGASRFRASGHDVDLYVHGPDAAPLVAEVKARKDGAGFTQLEKWLGSYDALFLRRDRADALVLLPWRVWAELIRPKAGV
jgi:Holliday junction resolvase